MTIYYDNQTKGFYIDFEGCEIPSGSIEITQEQHDDLYSAINNGCIIFDDLTYSDPKPDGFYNWDGEKWVIDEAAKKKASVPQTLSRAQAETVMDLTPATTLDESNKDKTLLDEINEYMDTLDITVPMYKYIKNVWKNSIEFNRDDDVITTIAAIFKITSDQLDEMFITGAQFSTTLES